MANVDNARGFRPKGHAKVGSYKIASTYNANIFTGDVVQGTADGVIVVAEGGNVDNLGVFAGCKYVNAQGEQVFSPYWPAGTVATEIEAFVYDDPADVFIIQADSAAADSTFLLADWDDGTGSAVSGHSGRELLASSGAATGKSVRIERKVESPDNAWGAHVDVEVLFVEHVRRGVVAGVGGI
jgi:hypothetical protein